MKFYTETVAAFRDADFSVNPFPLVWDKSDGRGILPDPSRGPRQTYETALFITRGDRKILRAVRNSISLPTNKSEAQHLSEKPLDVLYHFFTMLIDSHTTLLDPTCGSGTALAIAKRLGARRIWGMDVSQENAETTRNRLLKEAATSNIIGDL
jgi:DNA modification methylase